MTEVKSLKIHNPLTDCFLLLGRGIEVNIKQPVFINLHGCVHDKLLVVSVRTIKSSWLTDYLPHQMCNFQEVHNLLGITNYY